MAKLSSHLSLKPAAYAHACQRVKMRHVYLACMCPHVFRDESVANFLTGMVGAPRLRYDHLRVEGREESEICSVAVAMVVQTHGGDIAHQWCHWRFHILPLLVVWVMQACIVAAREEGEVAIMKHDGTR